MSKYLDPDVRYPYSGDRVIHHFVKLVYAPDPDTLQQEINTFLLSLENPALAHPIIKDIRPMPSPGGIATRFVTQIHYLTIGSDR